MRLLSLPGLFWVDLGDLVALDSESGHQSLLAEDEGIDIILHAARSQI